MPPAPVIVKPKSIRYMLLQQGYPKKQIDELIANYVPDEKIVELYVGVNPMTASRSKTVQNNIKKLINEANPIVKMVTKTTTRKAVLKPNRDMLTTVGDTLGKAYRIPKKKR
jgi:hypothetical protein